MAINRMTGVIEEDEVEITTSSSTVITETQYDIFDCETTNNKRSVECKCFICQRKIAAVRFAPHLEKCIGIGRNSRISRRKVATYADSSLLKTTTRAVTRSTYNATTTTLEQTTNDPYLNVFIEDPLILEEDEDEEWNATATPTKKRPKVKAVKKNNVSNKQRPSTPV